MIQFYKPSFEDAALIAKIGAQTFIESHGSSAPEHDITAYVKEKLNVAAVEKELNDETSVFRIATYNDIPVGYSKIIPNCPNPNLEFTNVCKMERLYVLKDYYDKKIGLPLFEHNLKLAKELNQKGLWLYVWTGNARALRFYDKQGFKKIGETEFKISPTHSNPNYWYYLEF